MSADRYFIIDRPAEVGERVTLGDREGRHLGSVVRGRAGDLLSLLDGKGNVYEARVIETGKYSATLEISGRELSPKQPTVDIAIAVIKAARLDMAVEKCTEIGVRRIIPFVSERSIWRAGEEEAEKKVARLRRKVEAACKQCGQPYFPEILDPVGIKELISNKDAYLKLFLADSGGMPARSALSETTKGPLLGIVGPEGGLSSRERDSLLDGGVIPLTLGPLRLRSETAAICLAFRLISAAGQSLD